MRVRREYLCGRGRVLIRARARLVGIRRARFGVATPAGRLAGLCWLCCVAVGCCPAAVIGLLLPCAPLAFSCCLRPVMGRLAGLLSGCCFPGLCRCWPGLSCCALLGGYRGRIYQATRRLYRARKTPPARLSASLAACFRRLHSRAWPGRVVPPLLAVGSPVCRFTCWAAPSAFGSLARSSGLPEPPRRTECPTENATKISSVFRSEVFSAHGQSLSSWYIYAPL